MEKIRPPRLLFLLSLLVLIGVVWLAMEMHHEKALPAIQIDTQGQPTVGYPKAKVHVVVFEEPKCPYCKKFNDEIFPKLREQFILKNKIQYTVFPVSFLPRSMPAAVALLCVYHQDEDLPNDELFIDYLDYMYQNQPPESTDWATEEKLKEFAEETSPQINLDALGSCIEKGTWRKQIVKNTDYGRKIMDGSITTPTVYINGRKLDDVSWPEIEEQINKALERQGVQP